MVSIVPMVARYATGSSLNGPFDNWIGADHAVGAAAGRTAAAGYNICCAVLRCAQSRLW